MISGWGLYPKVDTSLSYFNDIDALKSIVSNSESLIARGMGRSYGDSSLSNSLIVSTNRYNRVLNFNTSTGYLRCESGLSMAGILDSFVEQGWFFQVTPGTKYVSIGGAVASDIHGKNHHIVGSFASCVERFSLMLSDSSVVECSRSENANLYHATFGAMGLTGIILDVTIRLKKISSAHILQKTIKCENLDSVIRHFENSENSSYSVAWIDCMAKGKFLGKSVLILGEHAETDMLPMHLKDHPLTMLKKKKISVPFYLPSFALNKYTVSIFNSLYYKKSKHLREEIVDYDSYFYPLDSIHNWNRIYGSSGFVQYQCVLPMKHGYEGLKKMLGVISKCGMGSFLAVLKLLGNQEGVLSFPMKGYTLALDFPVNNKLPAMLAELDEITQSYDGRIYLTKDSRMPKEMFIKTYKSKIDLFNTIRAEYDPTKKYQSLQSIRLGI